MNLPKFSFPKAVPREPDPPGVATATMQFWFFIAVWAFALLGSLWMLVVFITGSVGRVDWFTSYEATEAGVKTNTWTVAADIHWAIAGGLFLFCAAIAIYNAVWLEMRRHTAPGLMRNVLTGIGIAVALFMISGATVVQQRGTDARARDDVIAAQSAQAGAAGIQAQIAAIDARLATMRDKRINNEYAATAANVGAEQYKATYMAPAMLARETPERRRLIERALGAAETAEKLEADKLALAGQLGAATVVAVKEQARTVRADGFMSSTATVLEDLRKPVTAILGELLAMTVLSAALAAWASRRQALAAEKPVETSALAIEDKTSEAVAPLATEQAAKEAAYAVFSEGGTAEEAASAAADAAQQVAQPTVRKVDEQGRVWVGGYWRANTKASGRPGDATEYEVPAPVSSHDPRVRGEQGVVVSGDESEPDALSWKGVDTGEARLHNAASIPAREESLHGKSFEARRDPVAVQAEDDQPVEAPAMAVEVGDVSNDPIVLTEEAHQELTPDELAAKVRAGEIAELSDEPGVFVEVIKADSHDSFANRRGLPVPEKEVA